MRTWDVIIVGGGIIGLSLSLALRKLGRTVLVLERGEPGREASHAAAGMLPDHGDESAPELAPLAKASARMYPEFVHELEDESGINVDLRDAGSLFLHEGTNGTHGALPAPLIELEPSVVPHNHAVSYLRDRSVSPRALVAAALKAARHREVDISSGTEVTEILLAGARVFGVKTTKTTYNTAIVVNCVGAWAGQIAPRMFPTIPVKGQILSVIGGPTLRHVVRAPEIYLVPRSDGQIVIGATVEQVGFDKRTVPETIQQLLQAAAKYVPGLKRASLHEAWAGLRPATADRLPALGETSIKGYFVATGHFRDGILLAPITAQVMTELITDGKSSLDLSPFSLRRFISPLAQNFTHAV